MMAKTPEELMASMVQNMKVTTGKTLKQWLSIVEKSNLTKHGEITKHLKTEHGVTHGYANLIALKFKESSEGGPLRDDDRLARQYSGQKQKLLPIYEAVLAVVKTFGSDVEVSPKKAYVSLRRTKQFALIQPSTTTRVDVGINLKGRDATDRLEVSGSFNSMLSHRVRLTQKQQVDAELKRWLQEAYEAAG